LPSSIKNWVIGTIDVAGTVFWGASLMAGPLHILDRGRAVIPSASRPDRGPDLAACGSAAAVTARSIRRDHPRASR
jgi:hypothetical protein